MPGLRHGDVPDPQAIVGVPSSRQIALTMAGAAGEAKAEDVVILDLRKLSYSFDYFFLCSASSERRIQTLTDRIREVLAGRGVRPLHVEGEPQSGWVLMDYGSVTAHLFSPEARRFYDLERLWADAPRVQKGSGTF